MEQQIQAKQLDLGRPLVLMLLLTGEPPDLSPGGLLDDEHRAGGWWDAEHG